MSEIIQLKLTKQTKNKLYKKAYKEFLINYRSKKFMCPILKKCFYKKFKNWLNPKKMLVAFPEIKLFLPSWKYSTNDPWPLTRKERKIILCFLWAMTLSNKRLNSKNKK
jgi:hypothetical protein